MPRTTTVPPQRRRSRQDWRDLLLEQRRSGLPIERFARAKSLSPRSLRWWAWKLRDELAPPAVEIVEVPSRAGHGVEVVVGDVRIVFRDAQPKIIAAVVRELRSPC